MSVRVPLRNYQQMVRVVRDSGVGNNYQLANSYGNGQRAATTDLRLRTLDELGMPSTSPRRPAPAVTGGELSTRETSIFYHELNGHTRNFFNGLGTQIVSRNDIKPGTKSRTQLGTHSFSKKIEPQINLSPFSSNDKSLKHEREASVNSDLVDTIHVAAANSK